MKFLQVLGTGCPKCNKLAATAETAAKETKPAETKTEAAK